MPTVPTRSILTAPLPGVRVPTGAPAAAFPGAIPGGSLGEAIQPALGIAGQEYEKARQQASQTRKLDFDNQLDDAALEIERTAFTMQGMNALGADEAAQTAWRKKIGELEKNAKTNDERVFLYQRARQRGTALEDSIARHTQRETEKADNDITTTALAKRLDSAAANYTNPAVIDQAVAETRDIVGALGGRQGWAPEVTVQRTADQVSKLQTGVIARMLDARQDLAAKAYYDAHKDDIVGVDQAKIEKALTEGSSDGAARRASDTIVRATVSPVEALGKVDAIQDPTVRAKTRDLVVQHFNDLDRAQRLEREDARVRVIKDLESHGGRLNRGSLDWQLIDGHPEGEHVLDIQRQILHPVERGDPDKYMLYQAMAATNDATRAALLATPIADIVNDKTLSAGQKGAIINLIRGERQRDIADVRRQKTDADRELRVAKKAVTDAADDDERTAALAQQYAAEQKVKFLEDQVARSKQPFFAEPPTEADKPAASAPSSGLNLTPATPAKPITPDMLNDLAQYGDGYARYLRTMGYDVPATLPKAAHVLEPMKVTAPATKKP